MDWTLLVQSHTTVEIAGGAEQIQAASFAVVALVCLVNICLCEDEDLCANSVPLDL